MKVELAKTAEAISGGKVSRAFAEGLANTTLPLLWMNAESIPRVVFCVSTDELLALMMDYEILKMEE